jgi:hypothetical protein
VGILSESEFKGKERKGEDVRGKKRKKRKKTKTEVFYKMREWIERLRMEDGL